MRTAYLDPDFRRKPKTTHFCCACQKDLGDRPHRLVMVRSDGFEVVLPMDWAEGAKAGGVVQPIGADCARRIGLEWSVIP